ncbi:hypothetical protein TNCT_442211 [Trichonephila clavata]|uniref:Uncharacterized protein n=1 Tax=Trichonephila clavata TaxID=2740835 RepID=A0A8X6FEJ4_TRICU|nr:hypothetical protein TNCT_442211 [Trichonephila clavata]
MRCLSVLHEEAVFWHVTRGGGVWAYYKKRRCLGILHEEEVSRHFTRREKGAWTCCARRRCLGVRKEVSGRAARKGSGVWAC